MQLIVLASLLVLPGFLLFRLIQSNSTFFENLVIGIGISLSLLALGGFISGWTQVFWARYIPSASVFSLALVVLFLSRKKIKQKLKNRLPMKLFIGVAVGTIFSFISVLHTLNDQPTTWLGTWYFYPDTSWQLALIGEVSQRAPSVYPNAPDISLGYTWSFHSALGVLASASGFTATKMLFFVWPILLGLFIPALIAISTYSITNRNATASMIAPIVFMLFSGLPFPALTNLNFNFPMYVSPTLEFAVIESLILILLCQHSFQKMQEEKTNILWQILSFFTIAVVSLSVFSSKGSGPVLIIGLIVGVSIIGLRYKPMRIIPASMHLVSAMVLGSVVAFLFVVKDSSGQLEINPLSFLANQEGFTTLIATIFIFIYLGWIIGGYFIIRTYSESRTLWLVPITVFITFLLIPTIFLGHPGKSQLYFYFLAVPFFIILMSWALAILFAQFRTQSIIYSFSIAILGLLFRFQVMPFISESSVFNQSILFLGLFTALFMVSIIAGTLFMKRKKNKTHIFTIISFSLVSTFIGFGTFDVTPPKWSYQTSQNDDTGVTANELQAFEYLKEVSSEQDIVATNRHCFSTKSESSGYCSPRYFALAGFSERRVLLGGWDYTPRGTTYWNPQLLEENDNFFTTNNASNSFIVDNEVGWLFVDKRISFFNDFSKFGVLVYENADVAIWKIFERNKI